MSVSHLIIPEIDVLVATVAFLRERGVTCYRISVARGRGIDKSAAEASAWAALGKDISHIYPFSPGGADIVGISATEWWNVECKGTGTGVQQTQRNNFDRALASAVSYYEERPQSLPKEYIQHGNARPYLGLALPESRAYLNELKKRVRQPLRKALNLWVLLYEPSSKKIRTVSPEDGY